MNFLRLKFFLSILWICVASSSTVAAAEMQSKNSEHFAQRRPVPFLFSSDKELTSQLKKFNKTLAAILSPKENEELANPKSRLLKLQKEIPAARKRAARGLKDEFLYLEGVVYEALGDDTRAEKAFRESLTLRSSNPPAVLHLGVLLAQQERCDEAVPLLDEAKWRIPEFGALIDFEKSECDRRAGKTLVANQTLHSVLMRDPEFVPALKRAVSLRLEARQKQVDPRKREGIEKNLLRDLRLIVAQEPEDRFAASTLSKLLIETSDPFLDSAGLAEAEMLMAQVVEAEKYSSPTSVHQLFTAQLKQRKLEEAKNTIRKGLSKHPQDKTLLNDSLQLEIEFSAQLQSQ